jgi:hypothetical protein
VSYAGCGGHGRTAERPLAAVMAAAGIVLLRRHVAAARRMRSHGLPNFPAPVVDSRGRPAISVRPWVVGFDADSGLFANLEKGCEDVMHPLVAPPLVVYLPPTARAADRQWDRRAPYEEKRNEK